MVAKQIRIIRFTRSEIKPWLAIEGSKASATMPATPTAPAQVAGRRERVTTRAAARAYCLAPHHEGACVIRVLS